MRRLISVFTACALTISVPAVAFATPSEPHVTEGESSAVQKTEPRLIATAKKSTVRTTATGLINGLNVAPPLYVGYKPGSFLPVGARGKKDKRGCGYAKQVLISLAIQKPKVGKKCKLSGGTWSVNFGTKIVKGPKSLNIVPILDDKDAWGQGAFAWTSAQRDAWARNTGGGTPTTRQQSTNQVLTTAYLNELRNVAWKKQTRSVGTITKNSPTVKPTDSNPLFQNPLWWFGTPNPTPPSSSFNPSFLPPISLPAFTQPLFGWLQDGDFQAQALVTSECLSVRPLVAGFLSNMSAWGLSVTDETRRSLDLLNTSCPSSQQYTVAFETALANSSFTAASSSTSQGVGVADGSGGSSGDANSTTWKTYSDYATPTGGVISGDLFGIHVPDIGSQPRPAGSFPNIPVGYVRLWDSNTSWRSLEPNVNGTYEWTTLDLGVQRIRDSGAKVMMVLGYTPAWASASGAANAPPTNFDDYSEYVRSVACRYGNAVSSYEVWNEGNLDTFWTGTPEQLADLTQRAYTEIKKCSGAEVIAASTGTRASGPFASNFLPYLQALAAKGWPIDAYSVHSYPSALGGADDRLDGLKQFKAMLASTGAPVKPIYDTELNYGLAGLGEPHVDLNQQQSAAAIIRSYVDSVRYGVSSTFWFLWTTGYYDKLGIQLNPTTTLNSVAWTQAWRWLVGSRLQRCSEFSTTDTTGTVTACQFTASNGQNHTVMWTERGKQARVQVTGLGSQSCDAWGECQQISGSIVVTDVPLWIGDPGGIYGPTGKVDPNAENLSVPTAPSVISATEATDNSATVTLKAPESDGGRQVTSYTVNVTDRSGKVLTAQSSGLTVNVPGLTAGISEVTATATNSIGSSETSKPYSIGVCGSTRARPVWTFVCTDFGKVAVGATKLIPVQVTNQSVKTHTLDFRVRGNDLSLVDTPSALDLPNQCKITGQVLPSKKSCFIYVKWSPSKAGVLQGTITGWNSPLQAYQSKLMGRAD